MRGDRGEVQSVRVAVRYSRGERRADPDMLSQPVLSLEYFSSTATTLTVARPLVVP